MSLLSERLRAATAQINTSTEKGSLSIQICHQLIIVNVLRTLPNIKQLQRCDPRFVQIHASVLIRGDAIESGKRKKWPRILKHWVSRSFRRVIAERRRCRRGHRRSEQELFSVSLCLCERLSPRRAASKVISMTRRGSRVSKRYKAP